MKIISKFRDYYDGVQIYGADPDLRYIRKAERLDPEGVGKDLAEFHEKYACLAHDLRFTASYYYVPVFMLFCGKAYPFMEIGAKAGLLPLRCWYAYGLDDAVDSFTRNGFVVPREFTEDHLFSSLFKVPYRFFRPPLDIGPDLFVAHNCPVILVRQNPYWRLPMEIIKNPCLREYGFASIIDPNTAYQELSMFLGSVLTNTGKPMVAVDEKKRIEKRGFDKWSFRKPPTKRKIK